MKLTRYVWQLGYEQGMKRFLILEYFRTWQQWRERKAASSNSWCSMIIKETKEEEGNLLEIIPPTPVWGLSRAGRRRSSLRGTTGGDDGLTISLNLTISLIVQEQKWRRRSFYLTKNGTPPFLRQMYPHHVHLFRSEKILQSSLTSSKRAWSSSRLFARWFDQGGGCKYDDDDDGDEIVMIWLWR